MEPPLNGHNPRLGHKNLTKIRPEPFSGYDGLKFKIIEQGPNLMNLSYVAELPTTGLNLNHRFKSFPTLKL